MDEIDALDNEALRLIALAQQATPAQAAAFRERAMRLIELAERMERDGATILGDQPSLRAAFRFRD